MAYQCRMESDSVSKISGHRLRTFVVTYPRIIHSQILTHTLLSRNSSSSRAIPTSRLIQVVRNDPYIPEKFGMNREGMQPGLPAHADSQIIMKDTWERALDAALYYAKDLAASGAHKQWVNRLLEPFSWITVIITGTEWENFFNLRCHPDAQYEIRKIAEMMWKASEESEPYPLSEGEWHLPFVRGQEREEYTLVEQKKLSVARCARVSYTTHDNEYSPEKDFELYDRLLGSAPIHASPASHQATPMGNQDRDNIFLAQSKRDWLLKKDQYRPNRPFREEDIFEKTNGMIYAMDWWCANYRGWYSFRKEIRGEAKW